MSNTGTILEFQNDKVLIMTSECDFIFINRKSGMFCGQQIEFTKKDIKPEASIIKKVIPWFAGVAAIFIALFSYFLLFHTSDSKEIYAYVDVDINPSIEFRIDKNTIIKDCKALDEEAQDLLEGSNFKGLELDAALLKLVAGSRRFGFLEDKTGNVLVSISLNDRHEDYPSDTEMRKNKLDSLANAIKATLNSSSYSFMLLKSTPQTWETSEANGISIARQTYYSEQKKAGADLTLDDARDAAVSDIMDALKTLDDASEKTSVKFENSATSTAGASATPQAAKPTEKATAKPTVTAYTARQTSLNAVQNATPCPVINPTAEKADLPTKKVLSTPAAIATANPTKHVFVQLPTIIPMFAPTELFVPTPVPTPLLTYTPQPAPESPSASFYVPSKRYTPKPSPTGTPMPAATDTPMPVATDTPIPTATTTPTHTVKPTEIATPETSTPTLGAKVCTGSIQLTWTPGECENFVYYKVVVSKSNPKPVYPNDGYLWFTTNPQETAYTVYEDCCYNGGDIDGKLVSGEKYYFSITYVYEDYKYTSNTLYLTMP